MKGSAGYGWKPGEMEFAVEERGTLEWHVGALYAAGSVRLLSVVGDQLVILGETSLETLTERINLITHES